MRLDHLLSKEYIYLFLFLCSRVSESFIFWSLFLGLGFWGCESAFGWNFGLIFWVHAVGVLGDWSCLFFLSFLLSRCVGVVWLERGWFGFSVALLLGLLFFGGFGLVGLLVGNYRVDASIYRLESSIFLLFSCLL